MHQQNKKDREVETSRKKIYGDMQKMMKYDSHLKLLF